jgi:isopenicillin N synthase-like dioxygenase
MIPYSPPQVPETIPLIDLAPSLDGDAKGEAAVAWEIHKAARETGFFYVKNHGIPAKTVSDAFDAARSFFEQPVAIKNRVSIKNWPIARGYEPMLYQQLDEGSPQDLKESFYVARDLPADHPDVIAKLPNHGPNQWPDDLPELRVNVTAYYHPMLDLGRHLMRMLALSLTLDRCYFDAAFREPAATLRLLHYPPHPANAAKNQLGSGAHTDFGAITLLAQDDCGGLEVENATGQWLRADPVPDTFVINLGDMVKRWTNDLYHSNMHRVLNNISGRDRYSMALFFNPQYRTKIESVPTCLQPGEVPKYPVCTAGEHVSERIRRSYMRTAS